MNDVPVITEITLPDLAFFIRDLLYCWIHIEHSFATWAIDWVSSSIL